METAKLCHYCGKGEDKETIARPQEEEQEAQEEDRKLRKELQQRPNVTVINSKPYEISLERLR